MSMPNHPHLSHQRQGPTSHRRYGRTRFACRLSFVERNVGFDRTACTKSTALVQDGRRFYEPEEDRDEKHQQDAAGYDSADGQALAQAAVPLRIGQSSDTEDDTSQRQREADEDQPNFSQSASNTA